MASINNEISHISDSSKYVTFDPTGSSFPASIKNVEAALKAIGPQGLTSPGLPSATETVAGIAKISTQAQITTGTDNTSIVTPAKLKFALSRPEATETVVGLTRLSTLAEALAGTLDTAVSINPKKLKHVFDNLTMSEARFGTSKVSTQAQAEAMLDNTTTMTPLRVKQAIAKSSTPLGIATETTQGIVRLATSQQTIDGVVSDGYAVTPKNLKAMVATTTKVGMARISTDIEMKALTDRNTFITPGTLSTLAATVNQRGIVQLTEAVNPAVKNMALSASANVVPNWLTINNKPLTGNIWISAGDVDAYNRGESDGRYLYKWEKNAPAREFAASWLSPGAWSNPMNVGYQYKKFIVDMSAKFDGWGDTRTRFFEFQVWGINEDGSQWPISPVERLEAYVYKGGSRGHDWQFQTGMTRYFEYYAGAGADAWYWPSQHIQIRPVNSFQCEHYTFKLSFSN